MDGSDDAPAGFREKYGGSDKLWATVLVVMVLAAGVGIFVSSRQHKDRLHAGLSANYTGSVRDEAHRAFLLEFIKMADDRSVKLHAQFLSVSTLKIVMPCDVDNDDLRFLSHVAAVRLHNELRVDPLVITFTESNKSAAPAKTAVTKWDPVVGDFVVKLVKT